MSFKHLLSIGSIGITLVTSNVPWFFFSGAKKESVGPEVIPVESTQQEEIPTSVPEPESVGIDPRREVNLVDAEDAILGLEKIDRGQKYGNKKFVENGGYIQMDSEKTKGQTNYLYKPSAPKIDVLSLDFNASEEDYSSVKKGDVKIRLFTKSAWNSENLVDEYETELDEGQVEELFENLDEYKVKQLLLSLSIRRKWKTYDEKYTANFWSDTKLLKPAGLDGLKDLKIKYFDTFEQLKKYVHTKVESCKDSAKACYARGEELSIHEHDRISFFQ